MMCDQSVSHAQCLAGVQAIQPQLAADDMSALQPAASCLQAVAGAVEGMLAAMPRGFLDDSYLQDLYTQAILLSLEQAACLSTRMSTSGQAHQLQAGSAAAESLGGTAVFVAFRAAERLLDQLFAELHEQQPPAWALLQLWHSAVDLLRSCHSGAAPALVTQNAMIILACAAVHPGPCILSCHVCCAADNMPLTSQMTRPCAASVVPSVHDA